MGVEMTPGQETNDLLDSPLHLALGAPLLVPARFLKVKRLALNPHLTGLLACSRTEPCATALPAFPPPP